MMTRHVFGCLFTFLLSTTVYAANVAIPHHIYFDGSVVEGGCSLGLGDNSQAQAGYNDTINGCQQLSHFVSQTMRKQADWQSANMWAAKAGSELTGLSIYPIDQKQRVGHLLVSYY